MFPISTLLWFALDAAFVLSMMYIGWWILMAIVNFIFDAEWPRF
jgi:hypothetical protein